MYSTHNKAKSVVGERFMRTFIKFIIKFINKIFKYMSSGSKNVYIDKLDDIVNKYKNTCHSTIKMKPVHVKSNTYIDSGKEINEKDPKFKIGDNVRISKYKNFFAEAYFPNWFEDVFVIKKVKNTVSWTYVINGFNAEKIIGTF